MGMTLQAKPMPLPDNTGHKGAAIYGYRDYFRSPGKSGSWYSCRDEFHSALSGSHFPIEGFYFGAEAPFALSVILDWVETRLNLKPKHRIKLYMCQKDHKAPLERRRQGKNSKHNVVDVELSPFWKAHRLRFYFLTVLTRAAQRDRNGIKHVAWGHPLEAIQDTEYAENTRQAVAMFLNGYTMCKGNHANVDSNWVDMFHNNSSTGAIQNLVRPKDKKELRYFKADDCVAGLSPTEKWSLTQWVHEKSKDFCF